MKKVTFVLLVSLLILVLFGCNLAAGLGKNVEVTSGDGRLSLSVPTAWNKNDTRLNEQAVIAVSKAAAEQYIIVISDNNVDLEDGFTLEEYFNIIKTNMSKNVENAQWTETKDATVNGNNAKTSELTGTVNSMKIFYWIYTIETTESFNQVIGWTLQSRKDTNKQVILDVINSFKEIK